MHCQERQNCLKQGHSLSIFPQQCRTSVYKSPTAFCRPSWLRWEAHAARPDQTRIGRLETPERPADRSFQVDVLVVRATECKVGGHQIAVRYRDEAENEAAWI